MKQTVVRNIIDVNLPHSKYHIQDCPVGSSTSLVVCACLAAIGSSLAAAVLPPSSIAFLNYIAEQVADTK
jgi:hypothetical protein